MKMKLSLLLLASAIGWQQMQAQVKKTPIACATMEPKQSFVFDTTKKRGLVDQYYLWDNGQTVYVKIMDGSDAKNK